MEAKRKDPSDVCKQQSQDEQLLAKISNALKRGNYFALRQVEAEFQTRIRLLEQSKDHESQVTTQITQVS